MKRRFIIIIAIFILGSGILLFLKSSSFATQVIWGLTGGGAKLFPLVSIAALIDSINPCAFSILLLTIAFLFSLGRGRQGILKIGLTYITGIFLAYLFIGLGILQALHLFNTPHFMGKVGSILLIGWGALNLVNAAFPSFPVKLKIPSAVHGKIADLMDKASVPAALFLGLLVGLCEFPCTGGPYMMVLGLLHDANNYYRGLVYLVWYNLLFVLPLVVILFIAGDEIVLGKLQTWKRENLKSFNIIGAIVMIVFGILILNL